MKVGVVGAADGVLVTVAGHIVGVVVTTVPPTPAGLRDT